MSKIRYILAILLMASCTFATSAQDNELTIRLRTGHNASSGGFAAFSLETFQNFSSRFQLSGGVQYSTIGKTSLEARPTFFKGYDWGNISVETLFTYRNLASVNSFAAGAGAGISSRWVSARLGYYYHLYGHDGEFIKEPFNIYYELILNLLPILESWDLQLFITNNEMFELERHYQPSFIAQCTYDFKDHLGLSIGIGCKPAGMFNLAADYYQSFLNLGLCYRW